MTKQFSNDDGNGTLLMILAGIFASCLLLASLVLFAGWQFYRSLEVANDVVPTSAAAPAEKSKLHTHSHGRKRSVPGATEPSNGLPSQHGTTKIAVEEPPATNDSKAKPPADPESIATDVTKSVDMRESSLKYSWDPIEKHIYEFDIEAKIGTRKVQYRGRNTIQGTGRRPKPTKENQVEDGSGTGFVIHPDGIVVTCAHVIKAAKTIKATLGGTTFDGSVIKIDMENDLALVRLDANNLPYLKLADSDHVRLGQDVRAIGYPLSDVLGKTIKVTKGEVSGRGGPAGADGLQIDATINPGNSGGPLVDQSGRLVGVTSSMLAGLGISEVGFAVPSNKVVEIAKELEISIEMQDESAPLSVPDIVDLVRPATVLLEVSRGPGGVGTELPHELKCYGHWHETSIPNSGSFSSRIPKFRHFDDTIDVSSSGELIRDNQKSLLPMLLGSASSIGIETLPDSVPGRTMSSQMILIQGQKSKQRQTAFDPYGFERFGSRRYQPWIPRPEPTPAKTKPMLGTETTTIVLGKQSKNSIELTKSYSLTVHGNSKDAAPLLITGTGKGKFDPIAGRMLTMNYKMLITFNHENVTLRIPITMNYRQLDLAELAKESQARLERQKDREKNKPKTTPSITKSAEFQSPIVTPAKGKESIQFESVEQAPESSNLKRFKFNQ